MSMKFELPPIPYGFDALEPYIDAETMEIHYSKHHQTYIDKLNLALEGYPDLQRRSVERLAREHALLPEAIKQTVRNNAGGHLNHSFFWPLLKKEIKSSGPIYDLIKSDPGGFEKFKDSFLREAMGRFGSGWAWLIINNGKLEIMSTANQDTPLSDRKTPLLGIDLWEHAYYLKYQNRRNEYIEAFFNVINWNQVNENLAKSQQRR
jgi:superoxide dismutase, Fe-Mn family